MRSIFLCFLIISKLLYANNSQNNNTTSPAMIAVAKANEEKKKQQLFCSSTSPTDLISQLSEGNINSNCIKKTPVKFTPSSTTTTQQPNSHAIINYVVTHYPKK